MAVSTHALQRGTMLQKEGLSDRLLNMLSCQPIQVHNTYRLGFACPLKTPSVRQGGLKAPALVKLRQKALVVTSSLDETDFPKEKRKKEQSFSRVIRGVNWILKRNARRSKAIKQGDATIDSPKGVESENLTNYPWTGPAEKAVLDFAQGGGEWNPLQINTSNEETSIEEKLRADKAVADAEQTKAGGNWKALIGLFFAFCLLTSADKAAMSVAPMSMAKHFGWLESDKGLIGSSFFFGFMFSQIPSSIVCKRIGRRRIMTGVALWIAACQLITPMVATHSLTGLLAIRAALGFGEGVVVPILTSMLADYIPAEKRSSSLAMVFSGGSVGTVLSLFLCPKLIQAGGWQPLFYILGAVSLAWGAAWNATAPLLEPIAAPKPQWNPFKRAPKKAAPLVAEPKLYTDSPLLLETGVKLATLAALGPDGKRRQEPPRVALQVDQGSILNGAAVGASELDDDVIFSADDPYWRLAPDARRKLRQRRIAIRGRFGQSPVAAESPSGPSTPTSNSPRGAHGFALPFPHSAQGSLSGNSEKTLYPMSAEAIFAAAHKRAGAPHLRPPRSSGTICSSVAGVTAPETARVRERIPWKRFFSSRAFWAIAGAHFCSNWGWNSFMAWLPTYFTQKLGLDLAASSTISLIPWMMAFLAGNTSGMLADWMNGTGMHKTKVRKIIQCIAFLGPATGLALLTRISTATEAVVIFCGILALGSFSAGGFCSNHSDISPKHSGTLYALTNTAGCLGGTASVALTGILLDRTGNWNYVWLGAAFMYVIGTLWYVTLGSTDREFDD